MNLRLHWNNMLHIVGKIYIHTHTYIYIYREREREETEKVFYWYYKDYRKALFIELGTKVNDSNKLNLSNSNR